MNNKNIKCTVCNSERVALATFQNKFLNPKYKNDKVRINYKAKNSYSCNDCGNYFTYKPPKQTTPTKTAPVIIDMNSYQYEIQKKFQMKQNKQGINIRLFNDHYTSYKASIFGTQLVMDFEEGTHPRFIIFRLAYDKQTKELKLVLNDTYEELEQLDFLEEVYL